jgi:signal transduction histidine kinase
VQQRWRAAGLLLALLGAVLLVRLDVALRREAFAVDARVAHRLLSQHAAQLDAVLATLVLLAPGPGDAGQRLPALLPSVLQLLRRGPGQAWTDASLAVAEDASRALPAAQRRAVLGAVDAGQRQYLLVLAGDPTSYALRVDARRLVPAEGWPLADDGPVRAVLVAGPHQLVLHAGVPLALQPAGLTAGFTFSKPLATLSQPFELQLQRATGPAQWPWGWLLAWAVVCAAGTAGVLAVLRARQAQLRSAELMRMAQVARLGTLGELAAGMAHELNQPLAAVLASTQAAQRLLRSAELPGDDGPDLPSARQALALAALQARRAADVVTRLRRLVQDPTRGMLLQAVDLAALAAQMLQLLAPELQRRGITARLQGSAPPVWADPVALEQIVHNLVSNALQALEAAATPAPAIVLAVQRHGRDQARLLVRDNGPGIAPEHLSRVMEPFFSTRSGGLGLGLPLCQSLAQAMGGELVVRAADPTAAGLAGGAPAGSIGSAAEHGAARRRAGAESSAGRPLAGTECELTLPLAATATGPA